MSRELEAVQVWQWLRWRLPPDLYMEAQQALEGEAPQPQDPQIAAGFAELRDPATSRARRLQLLRQLLRTIKDARLDP